MKKFLYQSAALGITMVHEAGAYAPTPGALEGYKAVMANTPVRYSASPAIEFFDVANAVHRPPTENRARRRFEIPGYTALVLCGQDRVRRFAAAGDGISACSRTSTARRPASPNYTADELNALVLKVKQSRLARLRFTARATPRWSVRSTRSKRLTAPRPRPTGINRIEHCALANPDQIARMKTTGRAAESPHEQRLLLRRRLSRHNLRRSGARNRFNPAGDFLAARNSVFDSQRLPVLAGRAAARDRERPSRASARSMVRSSARIERVPIEAALKGSL